MMLKRKVGVAIKSAKLFRNWIKASLLYHLAKRKILKQDSVRIECLNGLSFDIPLKVYEFIVNAFYSEFIKSFEYMDGYLTINNVKVPAELLYTSTSLAIATYLGLNNKFSQVSIQRDCLVFSYLGSIVKFIEPFVDELIFDAVVEVFFSDVYGDLDVKDRTVLDIGAGIGDSAIYFALKGARQVISLEPYPSLYKRALTNIKANKLIDRVLLLNSALGPSSGYIKLPDQNIHEYSLVRRKPQSNGALVNIPIYNLDQLVKEFNLENGVLKIDCEGCEYEALMHRPQTLSKFKYIQVEYHNGPRFLPYLFKSLGFNVKMLPMSPKLRRNKRLYPQELQGYIIAQAYDQA
jgi:FkbM family methyltransferase